LKTPLRFDGKLRTRLSVFKSWVGEKELQPEACLLPVCWYFVSSYTHCR